MAAGLHVSEGSLLGTSCMGTVHHCGPEAFQECWEPHGECIALAHAPKTLCVQPAALPSPLPTPHTH